MKKLDATLKARRANLERLCARALAALVLALFASAVCAAQARTAPQAQRQQQAAAARAGEDDEDEDESESVSKTTNARARVTDPAEIMRRARFVYVESDSAFVNAREIEDSLRKRKEFQAWGMVVTRNGSDADLVIQISRKAFTRRFTFTVVDPRTMEVVASGKMRSVLFGKKIPNKLAEQFANRVRLYRPYPPTP